MFDGNHYFYYKVTDTDISPETSYKFNGNIQSFKFMFGFPLVK